jgi:hypothetical protein
LLNGGRNLYILARGLKCFPETSYQFTIETDFKNNTYSQTVTIAIDPKSILPIPDLK